MSAQNGLSAQRKYVTLVSKEGFEFVVLREATLVSPAIRSMLDPEKNFIEAQTGRCVFHDIRYVPNNSTGCHHAAGSSPVQ
jgi:transcription elongation factor B subunit 1